MQKNRQAKHHHFGKNHRTFEAALLTWKAPEYAHHEKSALWFVIAGIILLAFIMYGLATDGWTFSIALIVFAGTYYLLHRETPKIVDVKISKVGVKIGRHSFPYSHMKGFWIFYDPPISKKLYLRINSHFHPDISISLEDVDSAEVRKVLSEHTQELPEKREPFSDTLVRVLKL